MISYNSYSWEELPESLCCKIPLFLAYIMIAWHQDISSCPDELEVLKFNLWAWHCWSARVHISVQTFGTALVSSIFRSISSKFSSKFLWDVQWMHNSECKGLSSQYPKNSKARLLENTHMNKCAPSGHFTPLPKLNTRAVIDCGQHPQLPEKHLLKIRNAMIW